MVWRMGTFDRNKKQGLMTGLNDVFIAAYVMVQKPVGKIIKYVLLSEFIFLCNYRTTTKYYPNSISSYFRLNI